VIWACRAYLCHLHKRSRPCTSGLAELAPPPVQPPRQSAATPMPLSEAQWVCVTATATYISYSPLPVSSAAHRMQCSSRPAPPPPCYMLGGTGRPWLSHRARRAVRSEPPFFPRASSAALHPAAEPSSPHIVLVCVWRATTTRRSSRAWRASTRS
jgi:hypothetical protein